MRNWLVMAPAALVLAACGGDEAGAGGDSRNELAAQACKAATESRLDGKLYEMDVQALASSPSRDELLAKLLGVMQAPVSGFACTLAALAKKREEEAAA